MQPCTASCRSPRYLPTKVNYSDSNSRSTSDRGPTRGGGGTSMLAVHALCGAGSMLGITCTTVLHVQVVARWWGIANYRISYWLKHGIEMNTNMQDRLHKPNLTFIVACSSDPNLTLILIITLNLTLTMILPKNTLLLSRVVLDINSIPLKKGSLQTSAGQFYSSAAPLWY